MILNSGPILATANGRFTVPSCRYAYAGGQRKLPRNRNPSRGKMKTERPTLLGSQLCEQLGFALRGNTGAKLGLTLGGQGKEPR